MKTKTYPFGPAAAGRNLKRAAKAWLDYSRAKADPKALNRFGKRLVALIRQWLPDGTLQIPIAGHEAELRQKIAVRCLDRYLDGNKRLKQACDRGDLATIEEQLTISVLGALRTVKRDQINEIRRRREEPLDAIKETQDELAETFAELSVDQKWRLVKRGLKMALEEKVISENVVEMVLEMERKGLSSSAVAERLSVSPSAISQRLRKVGASLRPYIDRLDF